MSTFKPLLLGLVISAACLSWPSANDNASNPAAPALVAAIEPSFRYILSEKMKSKVTEAKSFVENNHFDQTYCFLLDLSLPSGQNRFFVYDLKNDSVRMSGLVTHGNCNQYWLAGRKYSNTVGCGCSSLGKYKIGNSYNGKFGLAYKLYGLDQSNNKAFERYVVLHSHACVPEKEVDAEICQSNGCPTVAPGFLYQLKPVIQSAKKPVLLWIYE